MDEQKLIQMLNEQSLVNMSIIEQLNQQAAYLHSIVERLERITEFLNRQSSPSYPSIDIHPLGSEPDPETQIDHTENQKEDDLDIPASNRNAILFDETMIERLQTQESNIQADDEEDVLETIREEDRITFGTTNVPELVPDVNEMFQIGDRIQWLPTTSIRPECLSTQ